MTRPISRLLTVALTAWWVSAAHPALAQTDAVRPDSAPASSAITVRTDSQRGGDAGPPSREPASPAAATTPAQSAASPEARPAPRPRPRSQGPVLYKILTASPRGTYIQIARDLGKFVAPSAGIQLEELTSNGATENVRRLRTEADVKFAMVQSDVYQAYLDLANAGNEEARQLIQPLRVVLPLYNEEIYLIVRKDSPLTYIHQIEGQRISVGPLGSGSALTTTTLFRRLYGRGIGEDHARYQSNEDALASLVTDKAVDVVAIVAGQPAKVLSDMRPEARDLVKLLRFDPGHPSSKNVLETYFPATIHASSYPNLLSQDLPALAVRAYLVTYNYQQPQTIDTLGRFARALCANFATLQAEGHPKWKEVTLEPPALGRGWRYFPATERVLRNCQPPPLGTAAGARAAPTKVSRCSSEEQRALGLCPD